MRKFFGIVFAVVLAVCSVGGVANASDGTTPRNPNDHVKTVNVGIAGHLQQPGKATVVPMAGCSDGNVTNLTKNSMSYFSWTLVASVTASNSITVTLSNINPVSVVVRIVDGSGNEVPPRITWNTTQNNYFYTWNVGPGTYQIQASAANCCTAANATFTTSSN